MINIFFGILMLFVCATTGCVSESEPDGPSLAVGDSLPQFSVIMNNGELVTDLTLKGKVPVIVFFNTGCRDCQKELPVVQELWEQYKDVSDVKIVPIAREETKEEILEYWNTHNLTLPFSPQEGREVYNLFAPNVIPRIYVADKKGVIKACFDDSDMPSLNTLTAIIAGLIVP